MTSAALRVRSLVRSVRDSCPTTEGPSLRRRAVTFRSGRSPGSRADFIGLALPIESSTVDFGPKSRLQWRYRGGLSPPSLFSLGGHLNGQCFSVFLVGMIWLRLMGCQERVHSNDVTGTPVLNRISQGRNARVTGVARRSAQRPRLRGCRPYPPLFGRA